MDLMRSNGTIINDITICGQGVSTGIKKCAPATPANNLRDRADLARNDKVSYPVKFSLSDFKSRQAGSL